MPSGVVPCHVLIIFFLVGRLHCAGFQSLTEQILSLLFASHSERPFPVRDFFFLSGIDLYRFPAMLCHALISGY